MVDDRLFATRIPLYPKYQRKINLANQKNRDIWKWKSWTSFSTALNECSELQANCYTNFEFYREHLHNHRTYTHMKVWESLLNSGEDSRYLRGIAGKDTLVLSPRESGKSAYLGQWIAYQIGLHVAPWNLTPIKVLGVSYDLSTAAQRSRQVRAILRTQQYQNIFPWVRPSTEKWNEREWSIDFSHAGLPTTEEQYTYVCAGITGAINSRRAHLVLLDDLIKSPDAIAAESVRQLMVSNWEDVIDYTRFDGSRAVCLGTLMSPKDIYNTTFTEYNGWKVIRQSALLTDEYGNEYSYWEPEDDKSPGTPLKRLQEEREKKPISFSFQRQNVLIRVSQNSIDPNLIVKGLTPSRFESLVLGVDLSAGLRESNDYTAMILGGFVDGEYWVFDAWEDRVMGNTAKLDAMVEIWELWKHKLPQIQRLRGGEFQEEPQNGLTVVFDSSAYGLSLKGDYYDHIVKRLRITDWRCVEVSASGRGDKLSRLRKHTGLFDNGLIKFPLLPGRTMPDGRKPMGRLIEQITQFGVTDHDDLADAFELCVTGLRNFDKPLSTGNY